MLACIIILDIFLDALNITEDNIFVPHSLVWGFKSYLKECQLFLIFVQFPAPDQNLFSFATCRLPLLNLDEVPCPSLQR